jgi:hypothetical protein
VVLVAAAGGGLRAGYWTAIALAAAQDRDTAFARHVFAISSVSGGSLGAALFTALVRDAARATAPLPCARDAARGAAAAPYAACVRRFMADDFLSPVLAKTVAPDLAQRFLPFPLVSFDRSTGLEQSWEHSYRRATRRETFAAGVLALAADTVARLTIPALLLNSTHVESGKRYVASPYILDGMMHDGRDVLAVLDADEPRVPGADVPLSTAVHNSARFTYVSPAGHLDRRDGVELGRVVDGGYFENSGLVTLGEVRDLVRRRSERRAAGEPALRPVVLYLCNHPVNCRLDKRPDTARRTRSTPSNELLAPIRALLGTRDARGSLAPARLRAELGPDFLELDVCDSLTTSRRAAGAPAPADTTRADTARIERTRDRVVSPPLGWLLSKLARDWMDSSLAPGPPPRLSACRAANREALARLEAILGRE